MIVKLNIEEQNTIWNLLSEESKNKILNQYNKFISDTWDGNTDSRWQGEIEILEDTYGYHNLNENKKHIESKLTAKDISNAVNKYRTTDETRYKHTIGYVSCPIK